MDAIPAFLSRSLVALVAFVHIPEVFSQTHQWNSTNGSWNNSGSWSTGTVPSGVGVAVSFNNTSGATYDVAVADTNPTVGSITATGNTNNNVRLGHASEFSGILTLAATDPAGSPVLNVGPGIRLAIFCELSGSQGFTKSGSGILNFNTNPLQMGNLTGTVRVNAGTITLYEAENLGTGDILFTGNATMELISGRTAIHSANKTFTTNSGATATLTNIGGTAQTIFNGPLTGSGGIVFNGGNFTLAGNNSLNGTATLISARVNLGENRTLTSGQVVLSGNSSINLGNRVQAFSGLSILPGSTTNATLTNGTLLAQGSGTYDLGGGASQTLLNLSQIQSVTLNNTNATGNLTLSCAPVTTSTNNTLTLSANGNNTLRANTISIGGIGNSNSTTLPLRSARLRLGASNTIQATNLNIGLSGASANVSFQSASGNLTLRALNGTGSLGNWTIGSNTFGGAPGNGEMTLAGGRLEASFVNLTLGNYSTSLGPDLSGTLSFSSGNLSGTTITMATKAGSSRQTINATINQSGGTTTIQNLFMGIGGTDLARLRPSYNLTGGTLAAWTIAAGNGTFNTTESSRTLTISGNATLRNRLNGNLTITGFNSTVGGRINIAVNGPANLIADTSRLFTFGSNTTISGSGNISKSGAGTLALSSDLSNTYNGTLSNTQGSLIVNTSLPNAAIALAGGNMSGNGTIGNLLLRSGTLNPVGTTGNMAIGNLTWNSTATIRCGLFGTNGSERLVISGNFARGNGTTFTFNFNGGGSAGGSYIVATFAGHSFSQSHFQATNLAPGLSGAFVLGNNTLTFNISGTTPQTIGNFTTISDKIATDAPFSVTPPSASSGLPVILSIQSGNATISGNLVTLTGSGPVVVAANQPGNPTFAAAPEVTTSFNVSKASQTITAFSTISNRRLSEGAFSITPPTSSSGLPVTVTRSSGPVTVAGNTITPTGTGAVVLAANQAGNDIYSAATAVTTSFTILGDQVTLTVIAPPAGDGSITEGFAGATLRDPGVSYSITATPASGMRLARWLRNGSQISTSTTYTFTMNANTTLQPVFAPNFSVVQGTFNGLVGDGGIGSGSAQDMADFPLNNGYISIVVASTGNFTGNLTLENQADSFTGGFSENKSTTFLISRAGKSQATAQFNLSTASPGEISGNITVEGVAIPFTAKKGSYISANATNFAVILPAPTGQPLGHSYGTLVFSASSTSGIGSFAGRLSTNHTFSTSARIVDSGSGSWVLPIYSRITTGGNATAILTGELVVPKNPTPGSPTATAALEWLHFASPGAPFVPDGFLVALDGLGTQLATGNQTSMLTGNSDSGNFTLTLDPQSTLLASPISQAGVWTVNNTASFVAPVSNTLTFGTVSRTSPPIGTYSGTFSRPASPSNITTRYYGNVLTTPVTLPNGGTQLRGAGYFMTGNASVPVILTSP